MNTGKRYSKIWFLALLLAAFVAGCGSNNNNGIVMPGNSNAKAITAYSINGATGIIDATATPKTIAVTLPYGTSKVGLHATFTTTGKSVMAEGVLQTSPLTANDFTDSVIYTVTAANGKKAQYVVTVTVSASDAKTIDTYSIASQVSSTIIASSITVTMPFSTPTVTNLIATFSTSGTSVTVGTSPVVTQVSGSTPNNFTSPVVYTVHAADGTMADYTVTVHVAAAPLSAVCSGNTGTTGNDCVNLGTAGNYAILAGGGVTYTPEATITSIPKITGNIGVSPAAATFITGFALDLPAGGAFATSTLVNGNIYAPGYADPTPAELTTATANRLTAYDDAAGRAHSIPDAEYLNIGSPSPGTLTDYTLAPGVYEWSSDVVIPTNLNLNGNATDVWIFKISGTLSLAANKSILLQGAALPQNIFWQVAGVVTIYPGAHMEGVILSASTIALQDAATVTGRLLVAEAGTSKVTMINNTITQPTQP